MSCSSWIWIARSINCSSFCTEMLRLSYCLLSQLADCWVDRETWCFTVHHLELLYFSNYGYLILTILFSSDHSLDLIYNSLFTLVVLTGKGSGKSIDTRIPDSIRFFYSIPFHFRRPSPSVRGCWRLMRESSPFGNRICQKPEDYRRAFIILILILFLFILVDPESRIHHNSRYVLVFDHTWNIGNCTLWV